MPLKPTEVSVRSKAPPDFSSLKLWMLERSETMIRYIPGVSRVTPPLPNEARYSLTFDRAQLSPNAILRTVLEAGGEVVSFSEDVKHLNQAFMDLTEPGVRT